MCVLALSSLVMFCMSNITPFGSSVFWSSGSFGSSLVFTLPDANAEVGQKVAGNEASKNEVMVYTIEDVLRRDGVVYYRVSDSVAGDLATIAAHDLTRTVVFSVPVLGTLVRILTHTTGVMVLLVLPLFMLFINSTVYLLRSVLPTLRAIEAGVHEHTRGFVVKGEVRNSSIKNVSKKDDLLEVGNKKPDGDRYVTILKPYHS